MTCDCRRPDHDFPLLAATTGVFRKGAPRSFAISAAAHRLAFVRAADANTSVLDLWIVDSLDGEPSERLLLRAADLLADDETLSPAERARRERLRESGAGITGFSADKLMTTIAFALSGQLWVADVAAANAIRIGDYSSVVDPRLNSRGDAVAFTEGADFVVFNLAAGAETLRLTAESDTVSYGLADFIASEELERFRGHWWSADGNRVLVERNDEAPVEVRWISDPTHPENAARPHRYPQAGTTNSLTSLVLCDLVEGTQSKIDWNRADWEYLVDCGFADEPTVLLATRDQKTFALFAVRNGALIELHRKTDPNWVDAGVGAPAQVDGKLLTSIEHSLYREILLDGAALDLGKRHVEVVMDADANGAAAAVYNQPWQRQMVRANLDGTSYDISDADGYAIGTVSGDYAVVMQERCDLMQPEYRVMRRDQHIHLLKSHSQLPPVVAKPEPLLVGERELPAVILWPANHVRGSHKLPVIVNIYGGPHHSEVIASALSFTVDQWLANHGYAVAVIDNRGTPGKGPAWERAVAGNLADPVLEDQVAALQALGEMFPDDLDLERVGIAGWSFGGYLSALAVLDRPDVYRAGWAGAPPTDWRLYDTAYTERYMGHPDHSAHDYTNASLLDKADKLQRPLTLIHGLADDNVLAANSLQLSGALLAAGKAHNFLPLAGVSHMTPQIEIRKNLLLLERDFFDQHLRATE